jgi:hypothetical protein
MAQMECFPEEIKLLKGPGFETNMDRIPPVRRSTDEVEFVATFGPLGR